MLHCVSRRTTIPLLTAVILEIPTMQTRAVHVDNKATIGLVTIKQEYINPCRGVENSHQIK